MLVKFKLVQPVRCEYSSTEITEMDALPLPGDRVNFNALQAERLGLIAISDAEGWTVQHREFVQHLKGQHSGKWVYSVLLSKQLDI